MPNEQKNESFTPLGDLREFGISLARMIANLAVDPHGYFEKKYTARIEGAQTDTEIHGVVTQLVQWAASSAISDENRASLDKQLTQLGKPTVAELRLQFLP